MGRQGLRANGRTAPRERSFSRTFCRFRATRSRGTAYGGRKSREGERKGLRNGLDKLTGRLHSLNYGGQTVIKPGFGPKLDAFRARTDNDNWMDYRWPQLGLHNLKDKATAFSQQLMKDGTLRLSFTVESQAPYGGHDNYSNRDRNPETVYKIVDDKSKPFGPDDFKFTTNQIYTVYPDGSVELQSYITSNQPSVQLPRIGYAMELPKELNHFAYYGRGPVNNYRDRKTGQFVEAHEGLVGEQDIMLPKPQSMGNREDVRWCALTNAQGNGVAFVADGQMSASALPWSALELMGAAHPHQLPASTATHLHLDAKVAGLGGNSCGQGGPLKPDCVKGEGYRFGFLIRPVTNGQTASATKVSLAGGRPIAMTRGGDENFRSYRLMPTAPSFTASTAANRKNTRHPCFPRRRQGGSLVQGQQGGRGHTNLPQDRKRAPERALLLEPGNR